MKDRFVFSIEKYFGNDMSHSVTVAYEDSI